jgi:hypothetical protein
VTSAPKHHDTNSRGCFGPEHATPRPARLTAPSVIEPQPKGEPPVRIDVWSRTCEDDAMAFLLRLLRTAHASMTAVAVLLAGLPRLDCICLSSPRQGPVAGVASPLKSCCSTSSTKACCCTPSRSLSADYLPQANGCCGMPARHVEGSPRHHEQSGDGGCQKTLTPSDLLAADSPHPSAGDGVASALNSPPHCLALVPSPSTAFADLLARQTHAPPPSDLVIALLRLVI